MLQRVCLRRHGPDLPVGRDQDPAAVFDAVRHRYHFGLRRRLSTPGDVGARQADDDVIADHQHARDGLTHLPTAARVSSQLVSDDDDRCCDVIMARVAYWVFSTLACRYIWRHEGVRSLFKGLSPSLIGAVSSR